MEDSKKQVARSNSTDSFKMKWSEARTNKPVTVKVKGEWFAIGADKIVLASKKEVLAPQSQFELDAVIKAYPRYENDLSTGNKSSREARLKARAKEEAQA